MPNRRTLELAERLEALDCDPVQGLARISADPDTDNALRAPIYADLTPFPSPRRKAVEHTAGEGASAIAIRWANAALGDADKAQTE